MNTEENRINKNLINRQLTEQIIGAAIEVQKILGTGFLEKVYENALVKELRTRGMNVEQQKAMSVYYKGEVVGEYTADIVVENTVIVELKTVEQLTNVHQAQLMNYLRATGLHIGLLFNFSAPRVEIKRYVV